MSDKGTNFLKTTAVLKAYHCVLRLFLLLVVKRVGLTYTLCMHSTRHASAESSLNSIVQKDGCLAKTSFLHPFTGTHLGQSCQKTVSKSFHFSLT